MKAYQADSIMLVVTFFWGTSYLFMDMGLASISAFNLIALRFGIGFILVFPIIFRNIRKINFETLKYSFILGLFLFLVFTCITFGLETTTTSNAGFLIGLTVVFVPLVSIFIFKKKIETKIIASIILSFIGIGLLTIQLPFHIILGDLLCMMGAFFYALHIIVTSFAVKKADVLQVGILQLGFTGLLGLLFSILFETLILPSTTTSWMAILVLSILCTALGFVLQVVAQKYTSAARTGLIFSMEPIFAAVCGYLFLQEIMSSTQLLGACIVLMSIVFTTALNHTHQRKSLKAHT